MTWKNDLMIIIKRNHLDLGTFTLEELYRVSFNVLSRRYPNNNTIKASIQGTLQKLRDDNYNQFDSDLWKEMVEMGWTALTIPEKYNGLNFGYVGLGQVLEETGRKLTVSPMISTVLVSTTLISLSKNEVLKSKLFYEIMSGSKLCTLAHE